jgi:hypothetical protein
MNWRGDYIVICCAVARENLSHVGSRIVLTNTSSFVEAIALNATCFKDVRDWGDRANIMQHNSF